MSSKRKPKCRLTEEKLWAMKPGEWCSDYKVPGLVVRCQGRRIVCMFRYTYHGRPRKLTFGEYIPPPKVRGDDLVEQLPDAQTVQFRALAGVPPNELADVVHRKGAFMFLKDARDAAQQLRAMVARGEDPAKDRAYRQGAVTLEAALEAHLDGARKRSKRTVEDYRAFVRRYLADWLKRPLATLTPAEVRARHLEIGKRHGPYAANYTFRILRAVYRTARRIDPKLPESPTAAIEWYEERRREAAIPRELLPTWWREAQALKSGVRRDLYLTMLMTGLRSESARTIRVEDLDLEARTLHVPRPKGGKAFTIPLSGWLAERLAQRITDNPPDCPWLFPAPKAASGHIEQPRPGRAEGFTVPFTPHSLRHTFASVATAIGVNPYQLKTLLNHSLPKGDVTAGYLRFGPADLRPAVERIAAEVLAIVGEGDDGGVVVPLHRGAA